MSVEQFHLTLTITAIVMGIFALATPFLLLLVLYATGYEHDYELREPQWSLSGFTEWFFIPPGTPTQKDQPHDHPPLWQRQNQHPSTTTLPSRPPGQNLQLKDELLNLPPHLAHPHDTRPRQHLDA